MNKEFSVAKMGKLIVPSILTLGVGLAAIIGIRHMTRSPKPKSDKM